MARRISEKILKRDPGNGQAHNNLGTILAKEGNSKEAILHFQSAVESKPDLIPVRLNLSQAYEKAGRYDEALTQYEALVRIKPADKGVTYYRMAGVKSQQERFDECKNYLESSLKHEFDVLTHLKSDERFTKFRETVIYVQFIKDNEKERHSDSSSKIE
jgi:tetratricopeptide (TPR) repeat protein